MTTILPEYELFVSNKKFEAINRAKQRSLNVLELYNADDSPLYKRYAERILNCSNDVTLVVDNDQNSETYGRTTFKDARWCRVRHCPMCTLARSAKLRANYLKNFTDENLGEDDYLFLTLTVQNCSVKDLKSTINMMNKAWQRFTQRKDFPGKGFIRSFEVTMQRNRLPIDGKNKPSSGPATRCPEGFLMAHPHLHIVLCLKPDYFESNFKNKEWWITEWQSCLRSEYRPSVSIKRIEYKENLVISLLETLKYSTKPADVEVSNDVAGEWLYALTEQLHRVRAISVGGNIAEFCSQDKIDAIDNHEDDDEVAQVGRTFKTKWNDKRQRFDVVSGHIIHENYAGRGATVNSEFIKTVRLHGPVPPGGIEYEY